MQGEAAAAVAGDDRLVLVVGPAGAGKTRMLTAAATDLHHHGRDVFGVAPTAKAARILERDTGIRGRHGGQAAPRMAPHRPATASRVPARRRGDAARRRSRHAVHPRPAPAGHARRRQPLAARAGWRPAPAARRRPWRPARRAVRQRPRRAARTAPPVHPPVGGRRVAAAAIRRPPRASTPTKRTAGSSPAPSTSTWPGMADTWITNHEQGRTVALVASTQRPRRHHQPSRPTGPPRRRPPRPRHRDTDRRRRARPRRRRRRDPPQRPPPHHHAGEPVRNRDTWTVTAHRRRRIADRDPSTVDTATVTLPADYTCQHVRLGYAATEHGWQSDTVATGICLASPATTRRGLYVAATRGRDENLICVITDSNDVAEARDVLDAHRRRRPRRHPRRHPTPHPRPTATSTDLPTTGRRHPALRDPGLVPRSTRRRPPRPRRRRATAGRPSRRATTATGRRRSRRPHAPRRLGRHRARP